MKKYRSFQPWFWYLMPVPVLIWISKRYMGGNHVWYQEISSRGKVILTLELKKV